MSRPPKPITNETEERLCLAIADGMTIRQVANCQECQHPERAAYRAAELFGLVLAPAYQKTPMHQCASFLLWRWPDVEQLMNLVGGAALYELPLSRSSKLKPLPL